MNGRRRKRQLVDADVNIVEPTGYCAPIALHGLLARTNPACWIDQGARVRSRRTGLTGCLSAAGVTLAVALATLAPSSPAAADTQSAQAMYACTGGLAPTVQLPLQTSAPASVPEDGAALVESSVGFAPLAALAGPTASVVKVEMTFSLENPVGDVNLQFSPASIKARDWDARGGQQVAVIFQSEYPVPVAQAQLPVVTEVFTFDPASAGQRASWREFHTVAVTFDDGGVQTVVTCQAQNQQLSLTSTMITTPTAPHDTVIPAGDAPIRAAEAGTVGVPSGYDPSAPPPTPSTPSPSTPANGAPGTTDAGSKSKPVAGGGPVLTPGSTATAGAASGQSEVATGAPDTAPARAAWPWAIIAVGLAAAIAVVTILVRAHRADPLGAEGPASTPT